MYSENIVAISNGYVAQNLVEIQPNNGWTDKIFQAKMLAIGWNFGDEWCADSTILVWKEAYITAPQIWAIARRLMSANAQTTGRNFHADPIWPTSTTIPKLGALAVWQSGDSLIYGHIGIVVWISEDGKTFATAEGNTSSSSQPEIRTGWTYAIHQHTVGAPHSITGLNFIRFCYAIESYSPLVY